MTKPERNQAARSAVKEVRTPFTVVYQYKGITFPTYGLAFRVAFSETN